MSDASPLSVLVTIAMALRDGRIDAAEGADILDEVVELVGSRVDSADVIEWVGDLLRRDRAELLDAAERQEAKGHMRRAERLRAKAAKRA